MNRFEDGPSLDVFEGAGQATGRRAGQLTVVEREQRSVHQLGLPGLAPPRSTVVCTTVAALREGNPSDRLRAIGPRKVIDLRVAPSFRQLDLLQHQFVDLVHQLGSSYVHLVQLSNRHVAEASHTERYRQRLTDQFVEHADLLRMLRSMIDDGPVLLIVARRASRHLDALLGALMELDPKFEVQRQL